MNCFSWIPSRSWPAELRAFWSRLVSPSAGDPSSREEFYVPEVASSGNNMTAVLSSRRLAAPFVPLDTGRAAMDSKHGLKLWTAWRKQPLPESLTWTRNGRCSLSRSRMLRSVGWGGERTAVCCAIGTGIRKTQQLGGFWCVLGLWARSKLQDASSLILKSITYIGQETWQRKRDHLPAVEGTNLRGNLRATRSSLDCAMTGVCATVLRAGLPLRLVR